LEGERPPVVVLVERAARAVAPLARIATEIGGRDVEVEGLLPRLLRVPEEELEPRLELGQDDVVALHHRRRVLLARRAEEISEVADGDPGLTEVRELLAVGDRRAEDDAVDAAGTRPGDHVDHDGLVERAQQLLVQMSRTPTRPRRRPGRRPDPLGGEPESVELGRDASDPDRQADAAVHHQPESDLAARARLRLLVDCGDGARIVSLSPWSSRYKVPASGLPPSRRCSSPGS